MFLLFQGRVVVQVSSNGLSDHGVLTHKNLSLTSERLTDLMHLFRSHVVYTYKEYLRVLIHQLLFNQDDNIRIKGKRLQKNLYLAVMLKKMVSSPLNRGWFLNLGSSYISIRPGRDIPNDCNLNTSYFNRAQKDQ